MVLFRIRGVPVKIGWSWLIIFGLVFWSLASALFPATYPGLAGATYVTMAAVATVFFFVSILVHELSHTLRSLREGVPVRDISLWLFGGVSRADEPLPSPGAEFRVVAAGPLASLVLAVLFFLVALAGRALGLPEAVVGVPDYLARINGLLLAFNLVPALPLDGGRLLHALLWWRSGDTHTATVYAAEAGRAFAAVLIAIGLVSLLTGNSFGGIWFLFLGWFLLQAVRQEVQSARVMQAFAGLRVQDLMTSQLTTVEPGMTIQEFADSLGRWPTHPAYPVLDHGRLVGMLLLRAAGTVPLGRRDEVRVADVMLSVDEVPVVRRTDLVADAARVLSREPGRAVVRGEGGQEVAGLLSTTDLSRALEVAPSRRRNLPRSRAGSGIALLVAVGVVVLAAAVYHPPFVVLAPGRSFDIRNDVTITGVPVQQPTGRYLLSSVRLSQPNTLVLLTAVLRTDRQVYPVSEAVPAGIPPQTVVSFERQQFLDSQQVAAVAAARAAGYRARLTGTGARVLGLVPSSPAAAKLKVGDTVVAVGGEPIATTEDLRNALAGRPAGQSVTLTVQRAGQTLRVRVQNTRLPQVSGGTGIGVLVVTRDLRARLPFTVDFRPRPGVGGPSAGLAYALAVTDMLDRTDDARSRAVAATGTIAADGTIGPVGGVHEKAVAAADAGARIFLVPVGELGQVHEQELRVLGAANLDQAVRLLVS